MRDILYSEDDALEDVVFADLEPKAELLDFHKDSVGADGLLFFDNFELGDEILNVHKGPDGTVDELLDDHDGTLCIDILADFEEQDAMVDVKVGVDQAVGGILDNQDGTVHVNVLADFKEEDESLDSHVVADVTNGANGAIHSEDVAFSDVGKERKPWGVLPNK